MTGIKRYSLHKKNHESGSVTLKSRSRSLRSEVEGGLLAKHNWYEFDDPKHPASRNIAFTRYRLTCFTWCYVLWWIQMAAVPEPFRLPKRFSKGTDGGPIGKFWHWCGLSSMLQCREQLSDFFHPSFSVFRPPSWNKMAADDDRHVKKFSHPQCNCVPSFSSVA